MSERSYWWWLMFFFGLTWLALGIHSAGINRHIDEFQSAILNAAQADHD